MSKHKTRYILSLAIRVVVLYYTPTVIQNYTMVKKMSLTNPNTQCMVQLCELKTTEDLFEKTILEAIDEGFFFIGESCKEDIYAHLESCYELERNDIPYKIEHFSNALHQCFGVGAKIIEMKIIKALCEKNKNFTFSPKKRDLVFNEYEEGLKTFLTEQT